MIYLLNNVKISQDIIEACSSVGIANIISIVKTVLLLIQIIGPILCIVALALNFTKLMANPDEKKHIAALKNSLIALVILFMVPFLINLTMSLADDSFDLAKCWNSAEDVAIFGGDNKYVETSDKKHQDFVTKPGDYEENGQTEVTETPINNIIFVGDSRTVGMKAAVGGENDSWSCESGMGLSWMRSTGIPNIESSLKSGTALVILMGVNDLYQVNNYISYMNENVSTWTEKGAKVYFVSVNPTNGSYNSRNDDINSFNKKIKANLSASIKYIDSNSYLKSSGFSTTDGLHYTNDTYKKIYKYIKSNL